MTGVERIAEERARQVAQEGYSAQHDDDHGDGAIAAAAACYAAPFRIYALDEHAAGLHFGDPWPWSSDYDKRPYRGNVPDPESATPEQRLRLLVKAGALIAAEIDRLLRAGVKP